MYKEAPNNANPTMLKKEASINGEIDFKIINIVNPDIKYVVVPENNSSNLM